MGLNVMMKNLKLKAMTIASAIVAAVPRLATACATCGLSDTDHTFQAYKTSALFMVASPYISFAAIGGVTYMFYRRAQRRDRNTTSSISDKH
jgi:hypothetical protein